MGRGPAEMGKGKAHALPFLSPVPGMDGGYFFLRIMSPAKLLSPTSIAIMPGGSGTRVRSYGTAGSAAAAVWNSDAAFLSQPMKGSAAVDRAMQPVSGDSVRPPAGSGLTPGLSDSVMAAESIHEVGDGGTLSWRETDAPPAVPRAKRVIIRLA